MKDLLCRESVQACQETASTGKPVVTVAHTMCLLGESIARTSSESEFSRIHGLQSMYGATQPAHGADDPPASM